MKVFAFDIDGTLLIKGKQIFLDSAVSSLQKLKAQGHMLVVASGRGYNALDYQVHSKADFDYYICSNGATITDNAQNYRIITCVNDQTLKSLLEDSKRFNGAFEKCYYKGVEVLYGYEKMKEMAVYFLGKENFRKFYTLKPEGVPLNGKVYIHDGQMDYYRKKYPELNFTTTGYGYIYDFVPKEQSKGNALKILCEELGIDRQDVIAFGDDDNDLSMIEYANIGISMGNGSDLLKKSADYVTTNVENDGIYHALRHLGAI